jgi:hypothetical protein
MDDAQKIQLPRDLLPALEHTELFEEALAAGKIEIEMLIAFGDPRECDCCLGALRDRHCFSCHGAWKIGGGG